MICASPLTGKCGLKILENVRSVLPSVPIIMVSDTISEQQANEIMKSGATDFLVLDHLVRLPVIVKRELQHYTRFKQAEKELIQSNEKLRRAEKIARIGHWKIDLDTYLIYPSEGFRQIYGINSAGPLPFAKIKDYALDKYRPMLDERINRVIDNQSRYDVTYEIRNQQTGAIKHIRNIAVYDSQGPTLFGVLMDITEQVKNQAKLKRAEKVARLGHWEIDLTNNQVYASEGALSIYGLDEAGPRTQEEIRQLALEAYQDELKQAMQDLVKHGKDYDVDYKIRQAQTGEVRSVHAIAEYDEERSTVFGVLQDITKRKQVEEELRKSEARYQSLFEENHAAMLLIDPVSGQIVDANPAAVDFYGYKRQQLTSMNIGQVNTLPKKRILHSMRQAAREKKNQFEFKHRLADGTTRDVIIYSAPIRIQERDLLYSIIFDNTEGKKAESELQKLSAATEQSPALICITDRNGTIEYVNPKFAEVSGYERSELVGKNPRLLKSGVQDKAFYEHFWNTIKSGEVFQGEFTNKKKSGELYHVIVSVAPIKNDEGEIQNFIAVQEDITQRRKSELKLRRTLEEKEVLLKEIHHRVKNNLAVVSGIMELQAFDEENNRLREKLHDSISRIQTMAAIHELLYQSDSFAHLNFEQTLKKLANNLLDTFHPRDNVTICYDIQPITLNINQALPMALIANEVITNALKHAFDDQKPGTVYVNIKEEKNHITMQIKDNGHGFSSDEGPAKQRESLGMTLIETLTEQLKGESTYQSNQSGTTFVLKFHKKDLKGSASTLI